VATRIDPDLIDAVDEYLENLRFRMLSRLELGEQEHQGEWRNKSFTELAADAMEEEDDMHVYRAMILWKQEHT
jgi:hypothetical protein